MRRRVSSAAILTGRQWECYIPSDVEVRKKGVVLEDDPNIAAMRRDGRYVAAVDEQPAGVGWDEASDQHEKRGLPRAAGAENSDELAGLDGEVEALHYRDACEALRQAFAHDRHACVAAGLSRHRRRTRSRPHWRGVSTHAHALRAASPNLDEPHGGDCNSNLDRAHGRDRLVETADRDAFPHAAREGLQRWAGEELRDHHLVEGEDEGEGEARRRCRPELRQDDLQDRPRLAGAAYGGGVLERRVERDEPRSDRQDDKGDDERRMGENQGGDAAE